MKYSFSVIIYITFVFQENLNGIIVISSSSDFKHEGISLTAEGLVNLQVSSKNVGILEAFYNSIKVIMLLFLC